MKLKQPDISGLLKLNKKNSTPTPMIAQYLEVKDRHKDYLLFYRMGDFYELFFDDAVIAASNLGIALTKRGKLNDLDIPMCGVPVHSAQSYLSRLIKMGFKVAVAEQLDQDADNLKSKNQKIFQRDVVRIITPGTIIEDTLLDAKKNNNLLSIFFKEGLISIAWIDMTTGNIKIQNIGGQNFLKDLKESILKIEPMEIIISDEIKNFRILKDSFKIFEKQISIIPDSFYEIQNTTITIKYLLKNENSSVKSLTNLEASAVDALLNYLELTQKNNIPKIRSIQKISKDQFMQIDMFTIKSLEIFERYDGNKKGSLIDTIDHTKTAGGARLLRTFLKTPLIEKQGIEYRHALISSFHLNYDILTAVIKFLSNIPDLERCLARVSANFNNPRDLILVMQFIDFSNKIFDELKKSEYKNLKDLILKEDVLQKINIVKNLIKEKIVESPPINLNEGGVINKNVNERLDELRDIRQNKQIEIIKLQEKYSKESEINNLKIKFNNIHGYFIEITKKNIEKFESGKGSDISMVQNTLNASRYQTEELRKITREIETSEEESIELEQKIFSEISEEVKNISENLSNLSEQISFIDVITSFSEFAEKRNYCRPKILKNSVIKFRNGRHPVVEESLIGSGKEFVPNNCQMDHENNIWLMTGPNMAGKSTFLRQVAIIILLNQIGSYVPADDIEVGIFDKIFTRIGASDNLSEGMSTFMMEMVETSRIVNEATASSLVILDELGRGTSSEEGLAIAYAVLEFITLKIKSITLFATHYKDLCEMSKDYKEIKNKTLEIKKWEEEIIFHYKVIDGISEGSFGIHVANLAGVNKSIISTARKVLEKINKFEIDFEIEKNIEFNTDNDRANEISKFIKKLDLDNLSPKESLDILYTLKKNYFLE